MINNANEKKKINVLDLRDSPWVDGPGRTVLDCAQSIEGEDYHFVIGTFTGGEQKTNAYADEATNRGLQVITIHEQSTFDRNVFRQIFRIIDEMDIDIVHTHDFRSNLYGLVCAKLRSKPVISTVHGWIANDLKGKIYTIVDKVLLRFFNRIITVSERTKTLIKKAWISEKNISVITNALRVENYHPMPENRRYRDELGVSENTILIANIGRLSPEKGQLEFLQAGRKILQDFSNIKLLLIGIGPDQEKLETFVKENDLAESVIFTGYRDDMINIYNSLDLVVQSSYTEGMPNIVLEALLMEVPVIATDVGGTAEIIRHGENSVLVQPGLIDGLVENIRLYLQDQDAFRKMARNGRKLILEEFNHDKRAKRLADIYCELVTT